MSAARFSDDFRPQAPLIAQLLATRLGLPQTRTLRRAGADYAETAYRRADALGPAGPVRRDRTV